MRRDCLLDWHLITAHISCSLRVILHISVGASVKFTTHGVASNLYSICVPMFGGRGFYSFIGLIGRDRGVWDGGEAARIAVVGMVHGLGGL